MGADDRRKHPAVAGAGGAGGAGSFLLSDMVFFPPVGADVPWRRGGGCWRSCRGLFAFLPIICGSHVAVFGVSSYYMEKFKPGGGWCSGRRGVLSSCRGWCSVFVEKTNKEKKTRKRVKIFIKSVDTDTGAC